MRSIVGILGCLGLAAASLALADPPITPANPTASSAPTAAAPATAEPAKPAPVTVTGTPPAAPSPTLTLKEKELLSQGYKMEMRKGERVFCRTEDELGSRVSGRKVCGTAEQLTALQRGSKEAVEQAQQRVLGPSGK